MISNKCYYALKAVLELSLKDGNRPVSIADIAKAQGIPPRFLEGILRELKQGGVVDSLRGKEGGYCLAAPANRISVGQIIRLFEGELVCASPEADPPGSPRSFETVWTEASRALSSVLDQRTFAEMADHHRQLLSLNVEDYAI